MLGLQAGLDWMALYALLAVALSARIVKKPPIQAVFFRLHLRACAGCCVFMFTSPFQQLAPVRANSLSSATVFSVFVRQ